MQSSLNWENAMTDDRVKRLAGERLVWLVIATAIGLFALAVLLLCRRAASAIHEPLPAAGLILVGISLAAIASIAHGIGRLSAQKNCNLISEITLSVALFAVAATLTMPGASLPGLCFFWLILLAEEAWAWQTRLHRGAGCQPALTIRPLGNLPHNEPHGVLPNPTEPTARQEPRPSECVETILPEEVTQQLTRSTAADGTEELAGWLRVPFTVGQRTISVHLAFCPPFAHVPELNVEQIDGPETRIKAAQVLPYGARLDLKLHAASETPSTVVLQFSARVENKEFV
jgi:hypothetical protein